MAAVMLPPVVVVMAGRAMGVEAMGNLVVALEVKEVVEEKARVRAEVEVSSQAEVAAVWAEAELAAVLLAAVVLAVVRVLGRAMAEMAVAETVGAEAKGVEVAVVAVAWEGAVPEENQEA